jgi:hypothetical protein
MDRQISISQNFLSKFHPLQVRGQFGIFTANVEKSPYTGSQICWVENFENLAILWIK